MTRVDQNVLIEPLDEGCAMLTLNRPERGNALSTDMVRALECALDEVQQNNTQLVVLRGAGPHFCTGFDLSDLDAETDDSLLARFVRVELLLQRIYNAPFATLAIAHGRTVGAGADLFCACQKRWIIDQANFAFPGTGFGLVLGTRRLAEIVGAHQASVWVTSGGGFDTQQALQHGLATAHVACDALNSAVGALRQLMERIDPQTRHSISRAVRAIHGNAETLAADDLARLVRSAARPGLKQRIAQYRAGLKKA